MSKLSTVVSLCFLPCPDFTQRNLLKWNIYLWALYQCLGAVRYRVLGTTLLHWELDL